MRQLLVIAGDNMRLNFEFASRSGGVSLACKRLAKPRHYVTPKHGTRIGTDGHFRPIRYRKASGEPPYMAILQKSFRKPAWRRVRFGRDINYLSSV